MNLMRFLKGQAKSSSASIAKERLQIIVAHQRSQSTHNYLAQMQEELLEVVARYVPIDKSQIKIEMENQDHCSVLEVNIILPEREKNITITQ